MWGRAYTRRQRARDVHRAMEGAPAKAAGVVSMHVKWGHAYTRRRRARDVCRAAEGAPAKAAGVVTAHAGRADQESG